jgi:hypothetical protein
VLDLEPQTETVPLYDTNFSALNRDNIAQDGSFEVRDSAGTVYTETADYVVNYLRGSIRRTNASRIPAPRNVRATYRYYPVYQSTALSGEDDNPVFDGLRLRVVDAGPLDYDPARTRWVQGDANLASTVRLSSIGSRKALHPADYEITFSSQDIDSAITFSGGTIKIPVRYTVKAVTRGQAVRVWTFLGEQTATRNRQWDPGEEIAIFKPGSTGLTTDTLTWGVILARPADTSVTPVLPGDGDVLFIGTKRAFDARDAFTLRTEAGRVDETPGVSLLDRIYVVPNPYIGFNEIEPINRLPGQTRGERRIYFENLPRRCTIRIYTLNGDLVHTLEHDTGMESGREYWNLLNRDGFTVAYGVYVAHIDAPGIGERILKFALIK